MTGRLRVTGRFGMPRWVSLGLLGLLLLGVLAMHGLVSHHVTDVGHGEIGATASIPDMSSPPESEADPCEAAVCHKGDHEASTVLLTFAWLSSSGSQSCSSGPSRPPDTLLCPGGHASVTESGPSRSAVQTRPTCINSRY
jgi:hypothetical protein